MSAPCHGSRLVHLALFYSGEDEYVDGVGRFLRAGLEDGRPVVAAVPRANGDLLRESLDGDRDSVRILDMTSLGRNPGRIIPAIHSFLDEHEGRRLHFVGEPIWPGRTPEEAREATRHEALINLAFAERPIDVLCPYDVDGLDAAVIEDAHHTHPQLISADGEWPSARFGGHAAPPSCDAPLAPVPEDAATLEFEESDLTFLRSFVGAQGIAGGLAEERAADLVLAANELASNTIEHARSAGTLAVWRDGGFVTCEIADGGHIADPLAGRRLPRPGNGSGRGLWIVNQLCDLVETRSGPDGTTVRLHIHVH